MNFYESYEDDFENDEAALDEQTESDLAEASEASLSQLLKMRPKTAHAKNYSPTRPTERYVGQAQFRIAIEGIRRDMRQNADAIQKLSGATNRNNKLIAAANSRQDKEISGLKKDIKDLKKQGELASLMPFLMKPTLTATDSKASVTTAGDVATQVQVSSPDLLMTMVLGGFGGFGGSSSGDSSFNPLMILALTGALNGPKK